MRAFKFRWDIIILFVLLSIALAFFSIINPTLHVTEIIRLDEDPGTNPVFSPNGEQIAFVKNGELVVMNLSTNDQNKHEIEGILSDIQWLTNSRLLYLKRELPDVYDELSFWIVDVQSGKTIPLTEILPEHPENVTLSPSKSTIAYSTQTRIRLFDIKTESFSFVPFPTRGRCHSLAWLSNETVIYSCSQQLWETNISSGESRMLFDLKDCNCYSFSPSPDGRWLLYEAFSDKAPPESSFYIVPLQSNLFSVKPHSRLNLAGSFIKHLLKPNYFEWPGVSQTSWAPDGKSFVFSGSRRVWQDSDESFQDGIWLVKLD